MATGSITKYTSQRGIVSYRARAEGGLDPASGKRRQVLKTFRTKQEAQTWVREQQRRVDQGLWADGGKILLKDWITQWLDLSARTRRPSTVHTNTSVLARVATALGHVPLAKLRPAQLETFLQQQEAELAPTTARTLYAVLHTCLADAERLGIVAEHPLRRVQPPRLEAPARPSWTVEQVRQFWATAATADDATFWLLLLTAGLRVGEALALTWADVDLASGLLQVRRTITRARSGREVVGTTTKSGKARTVPLAPQTIAALHGQRAQVLAWQLAMGDLWRAGDLLFPTGLGTTQQTRDVRRRLDALCRQAEVPRITPHGLRHTAGSLLAAQAPAAVVRDVLGHHNIAVSNTYLHTSTGDTQRATAALGDLVTGA